MSPNQENRRNISQVKMESAYSHLGSQKRDAGVQLRSIQVPLEERISDIAPSSNPEQTSAFIGGPLKPMVNHMSRTKTRLLRQIGTYSAQPQRVNLSAPLFLSGTPEKQSKAQNGA